jgi:hypothetical protein
MSAFMFFSNANRDIVKAQNPGLSFTEVASEIGQRWGALSASDRRPYAALADQDKERYFEEKRLYVPDPKYLMQDQKPGKKIKDPNAPKRAMSGFMFFSNHMRPKLKARHPSLSFIDMGHEIGKLWRGMNEKKRTPYMALAAEDAQRYRDEKAVYVPPPKFNRQVTTKNGKKKKDPNAPKRGMSAYLYFCQAYRPQFMKRHPGQKITDIAKLLSVKWRKINGTERAKFDRQAAVDKKRYQREKAKYEKKQRR